MSQKLQQILELLLSEETQQAEELLHEYVIEKARRTYESILDDETNEFEEDIDQSDDFLDDIAQEDYDEEIDQEEAYESEDDMDDMGGDDMGGDDMGGMDDMGDMGGDDMAEPDLEDEVAQLAAELEELRADFEKMSGDDQDDDDSDDEDDDDEDEDDLDENLVEYDLEEDDIVEEATNFSNKVASPKPGAADKTDSPFTKIPKRTVISSQGKPVHIKDGSEGRHDHGAKTKSQNPTNMNIRVDHKKGPAAVDGKGHQDGSNKSSPLTKVPR
jgi:hypothetical protein